MNITRDQLFEKSVIALIFTILIATLILVLAQIPAVFGNDDNNDDENNNLTDTISKADKTILVGGPTPTTTEFFEKSAIIKTKTNFGNVTMLHNSKIYTNGTDVFTQAKIYESTTDCLHMVQDAIMTFEIRLSASSYIILVGDLYKCEFGEPKDNPKTSLAGLLKVMSNSGKEFERLKDGAFHVIVTVHDSGYIGVILLEQ